LCQTCIYNEGTASSVFASKKEKYKALTKRDRQNSSVFVRQFVDV
jgi:hypothetical protein